MCVFFLCVVCYDCLWIASFFNIHLSLRYFWFLTCLCLSRNKLLRHITFIYLFIYLSAHLGSLCEACSHRLATSGNNTHEPVTQSTLDLPTPPMQITENPQVLLHPFLSSGVCARVLAFRACLHLQACVRRRECVNYMRVCVRTWVRKHVTLT